MLYIIYIIIYYCILLHITIYYYILLYIADSVLLLDRGSEWALKDSKGH